MAKKKNKAAADLARTKNKKMTTDERSEHAKKMVRARKWHPVAEGQ